MILKMADIKNLGVEKILILSLDVTNQKSKILYGNRLKVWRVNINYVLTLQDSLLSYNKST
jgi:dTDP-glucose pyrophosphorylase